jgi:Arc/MetJ-type ribon-helix-helix transcriptional regulator
MREASRSSRVGRSIIMNIALTEDLQRPLRRKVENGQFSNEQAVVEEALRVFLIEESKSGPPLTSSATEPEEDEEVKPWRGIFSLQFPEEVLFTKQIDIRPKQLDEWRPRGVTSERRSGGEPPYREHLSQSFARFFMRVGLHTPIAKAW